MSRFLVIAGLTRHTSASYPLPLSSGCVSVCGCVGVGVCMCVCVCGCVGVQDASIGLTRSTVHTLS